MTTDDKIALGMVVCGLGCLFGGFWLGVGLWLALVALGGVLTLVGLIVAQPVR